MSTVESNSVPPAHGGPDGTLSRLRAALHTARLRLEVAIAVLTTISDHIEDHDGQALVIADITRQWQRLDRAARRRYARPGSPFSPLTWYAWAYLERLERAPFAGLAGAECPPPAQADRVLRRHWHRHVDRLRAGARLGRTGPGPAAGH